MYKFRLLYNFSNLSNCLQLLSLEIVCVYCGHLKTLAGHDGRKFGDIILWIWSTCAPFSRVVVRIDSTLLQSSLYVDLVYSQLAIFAFIPSYLIRVLQKGAASERPHRVTIAIWVLLVLPPEGVEPFLPAWGLMIIEVNCLSTKIRFQDLRVATSSPCLIEEVLVLLPLHAVHSCHSSGLRTHFLEVGLEILRLWRYRDLIFVHWVLMSWWSHYSSRSRCHLSQTEIQVDLLETLGCLRCEWLIYRYNWWFLKILRFPHNFFDLGSWWGMILFCVLLNVLLNSTRDETWEVLWLLLRVIGALMKLGHRVLIVWPRRCQVVFIIFISVATLQRICSLVAWSNLGSFSSINAWMLASPICRGWRLPHFS